MKKILKIILVILLWIISLVMLIETISSFLVSDPWGLGFIFYTLPLVSITILLIVLSIYVTKNFLKKC